MSEGPIDPNSWPPSVKDLHPVAVDLLSNALVITTYRQTGQGVKGYIVAHQEPHLSHYTVTPTSKENIYEFDFNP